LLIGPNHSPHPENKISRLKNRILEGQVLLSTGINSIVKDGKIKKEDLLYVYSASDFIEIGLKSFSTGDTTNWQNYFFIVALYELLDFAEHFNASFNTSKDRRKMSVREPSYKNIINANGFLISAQNALDKGTHYLTINLTLPAFRSLQNQISQHEEDAKNKLSVEEWKTLSGKTNANKRHSKSSAKQKEIAISILKSGTWPSLNCFKKEMAEKYLSMCKEQKLSVSEHNAEDYISKKASEHITNNPSDAIHIKTKYKELYPE